MEQVTDPDRFCLAAVQQYLYEHGYTRALAALEQEAGLMVKDEATQGGQLLQLVYDHMERQLAASSAADDVTVERRRLEERLLSGGTASGPGDCPSVLARSIEGLHAANVIAIDCWPARRLAVTGSSDGSLAVLSYEGALQRTVAASTSGILCLALQQGGASAGLSCSDGNASPPAAGSSSSIVAVGCMDGSIVVLDAGSGVVLARAQPHRKYIVALQWAPDGRHLVSAAWDNSFAVHRLQRQPAAAAEAEADAAVAAASNSSSGSSSDGGWELVTNIYVEQTPARVNALAFLPASSSSSVNNSSSGNGGSGTDSGSPKDASSSCSSSSSFLVAVQGSNYLRQLSITTTGCDSGNSSSSNGDGGGDIASGYNSMQQPQSQTVVREERRINMNALGNDHVSFSAAHLAFSPCGRLLLVSADNGRLVVYDAAGWSQMRSMVGLPVENFHQFCAAWHRSGNYVMAGAAHGGLCIFHVGSAKRVATLAAHSKNVRGLVYDACNNLLLTCSFDRTVKIFKAAADDA